MLKPVFDHYIPIRIPSTESRWAGQATLTFLVALIMVVWTTGTQGQKTWFSWTMLAVFCAIIARPAWVYISIVIARLLGRSLIYTTSEELIILSRCVFVAPLGDVDCFHETYDREAIRFQNKRNGKQFIIFRDWTEPAAFDRLIADGRSPITTV